mgnify:CR=1 FL=1
MLDLFEDASGNVWLASKSQGVMKWSPLTSRFQHITSTNEPKLSHDNIWALHQDKNEKLWIGTDNGLNRVDLTRAENTVF